MQKVHDPSKNRKWVDYPDIESPIIADELNRHETELDEIDSRVVVHETTKANQVDLLTCVASITLNTTTGILTITLKNGSSTTIDTGLSKLAVNFDYDADPTSPHYEQLILEMADGTYKYIDLSALITQFEFVNSATITWTVGNDGTVTANIINGSITEAMLETNFLANCRLEVSKALGFSQDAEAWAKGTKGGTPVASTDERYHNNSKYYSEQSKASSEDSEAWAVGERNGVPVENTDETYENNAKYYASEAAGYRDNYVGTCTGQGANQIKVVTISSEQNFTLHKGAVIAVKFDANNTYSATAENPIKLNVNNTGAKQIYGINTATPTGTNTTYFGRLNYYNYYVYDGTYWIWAGSSADNSTTYTPQKLGIGYGTCSTAAATAEKAVTLSGYELVTNGTIAVKFTNAVPASATLKVNSKTAKAIYYRGSAITANKIKAGDTAIFYYNGSQYHLICVDRPLDANEVTFDNEDTDLVSEEVESAIKEVNAKFDRGSVSVTGNGSKTYAQLLNELSALVDYSKLTHNSRLIITTATYKLCYHIMQYTSSVANFTYSSLQTTNPLTSVISVGSASAIKEWNGTTVSDAGSIVVTVGQIFTIHY